MHVNFVPIVAINIAVMVNDLLIEVLSTLPPKLR